MRQKQWGASGLSGQYAHAVCLWSEKQQLLSLTSLTCLWRQQSWAPASWILVTTAYPPHSGGTGIHPPPGRGRHTWNEGPSSQSCSRWDQWLPAHGLWSGRDQGVQTEMLLGVKGALGDCVRIPCVAWHPVSLEQLETCVSGYCCGEKKSRSRCKHKQGAFSWGQKPEGGCRRGMLAPALRGSLGKIMNWFPSTDQYVSSASSSARCFRALFRGFGIKCAQFCHLITERP